MEKDRNEIKPDASELLDSILNGSSRYAIIATDLNDKIILWNKGAEIIYGYSSDEMVYKQTPLSLHKKGEILYLTEKTFHTDIFDQELTAVRKDGTTVPVSVTVTPRINKNNITEGFLIIVRDITSIKLQDKYRDILIEIAHLVNLSANINDMCNNIINAISTLLEVPIVFICLLDKISKNFYIDQQIGLSCDSCKHYCSYTYDDRDVYANMFDCFLSYSQSTINSSKLQNHAIFSYVENPEIKESDSTIIHIPLLSESGLIGILHIVAPSEKANMFLTETQFFSLIANEISSGIHRKRDEEEIKQHANNMEDIVKEHTARLREKDTQLVQSGKLATLGEMATGIAHEINQPLGSISLMVQGLLMAKERSKLSDELLNEKLVAIIEQIERIDKIITHLRTFARQPSESNHEVIVNEPLMDVFKLIGQQLQNRNITVETYLTEEIPSVLADHNKLEQVFLNILSNARDALDDFEVTIEKMKSEENHPVWINSWSKKIIIKTYTRDRYVFIEIIDNAGGIPESILNKIFEPFFTTKEVGKGTGLGLSISYGIIKDFDGTIEVKSEELSGSVFTVKLPIYRKPARKAE